MKKRLNVRSILYREAAGGRQFLLLWASGKQYWQNPQGGVEEGESLADAVRRETCEETGLNPSDLEVFLGTSWLDVYDAVRDNEKMCVKSLAMAVKYSGPDQEIKLSKDDGHKDSRWCSYEEALSMLVKYSEQKRSFMHVYRNILQVELPAKA